MSKLDPAEYEALLSVVPNFRDVGGHTTRSGAGVRTGLVYRSGQLDKLTEPIELAFSATNISTVFDLRTTAEAAVAPDQLPTDVTLVHLDVLADHEDAGPAQLGKLVAVAMGGEQPAAEREQLAEEILGHGKAEHLMKTAYEAFVTLDSARAAYRTYFTALAEGTDPVLFHCTAGKDRTGWAAASLLLHLGVDQDTVLADYLASYEPTMKAFKPLTDYFASQGGDLNLILPMLEVRADYLNAAIAVMNDHYGSIHGYLTKALGLRPSQLDAITARLLTDH